MGGLPEHLTQALVDASRRYLEEAIPSSEYIGWVAAALMQRILDWATANGVKSLVLHASDDGRPLYEKLGFTRTSEMRYSTNRR